MYLVFSPHKPIQEVLVNMIKRVIGPHKDTYVLTYIKTFIPL